MCLCFQINNPDMRVQILKDFVKQHFPSTELLDYALDVEKITTSKVLYHQFEFLPFSTLKRSVVIKQYYTLATNYCQHILLVQVI